MRIPNFTKFVEQYTIKDQLLNDSTLVVDGQNFFYRLYQRSGLQFLYGCECDRYLEFLKQHLSMFKTANVQCYFLFKGGHKSVEKRAEKAAECDGKFIVGQPLLPYEKIVPPIFMWNIHRQALKEMGFSYAVCEFEAKTECVALARKLQCPIVSHNTEFCLYDVPFISYFTLNYNHQTQALTASVFKLDHFLDQLRIDTDKLSTFVALMDEQIFPANYFAKCLHFLRLPLRFSQTLDKYERIFKWLASTDAERAMKVILAGVISDDQVKFTNAKEDVKKMLLREPIGIPSEYLEVGCRIEFTENDPFWFEKGVVSGHISVVYVNLYRSSTIIGSHAIANEEAEEPLMLSSEIIKYAYNLLTNYQKESFLISPAQRENIVVSTKAGITKPVHEAKESVFENGWDNIKSLGLFEHFLTQTITGFESSLVEIPEEARLLMIAFWYYKRYSSDELTDVIVASVLLSYISLGVVKETQDDNNNKNIITQIDKEKTKQVLTEFQTPINYSAACKIFEPKLIHPFVEFQHCLDHLGLLNNLCGAPYRPIVFSMMINATFVYKVIHAIVYESKADYFKFISDKLSSAPTVLGFLEGLLKIYLKF